MPKKPKSFITEVPLTTESRVKYLEELFAEDLPNEGGLFTPNDNFYIAGSPQKQARHMTNKLCAWLGVKPGYIGLEFEYIGSCLPDGSHYTIYIESTISKDEFALGGYLAYALTRYLVEERKQVNLPEIDQQNALIAHASILFGLSIVILNGFTPAITLGDRFIRRRNLIKSFPLDSYRQNTLSFINKRRISTLAFHYSLTPWAAKQLGFNKPKHPSHAVRDVRQKVILANLKLFGLVWLLILICGIGIYTQLQRASPANVQLERARKESEFLGELVRLCDNALKYDRQYSDVSDIQTLRALNAKALRCESLKNQHSAADKHYQNLTP